MLIVKINQSESIERALKRFKRKFNMTGVMKQLKKREQFTKKSLAKREEVNTTINIIQDAMAKGRRINAPVAQLDRARHF